MESFSPISRLTNGFHPNFKINLFSACIFQISFGLYFNLPIFNLDLSSVKNNADLLKLVTDINYLSNNKKYIVTIEDIDRCPLFSTSYDRHRQLDKNTLSIDCLLNVLDGIIETHGRLFFMSANDVTPFDKIKDVLFRPGRVDKQLNITYCSRIQITKII